MASHTVCDKIPLPSYGNRDLYAYIQPRGVTVTISVVLSRRYLPMVFYQRRYLYNSRIEPEAIEIFPK